MESLVPDCFTSEPWFSLKSLLSLPFSIYSTFVIEERFGFNKTTPATFVTDRIKSLLLSVVLGAPLLAGIIAFFEFGGSWAWVWAWLIVTAFTLFIQFIAPTWIMPIFNKFEPLEDGDLRQKIRDYAAEVRFPLQGVYVMDGSKRSTKSNAFFTGFGKNKRIALFDTLIEKHTPDELGGCFST
jgi:STE24 endopeptidase